MPFESSDPEEEYYREEARDFEQEYYDKMASELEEGCVDEYFAIDETDFDKKIKNKEIRKKRAEIRKKKKAVMDDNSLMRKIGRKNKARGKRRFNKLLKRRLYWVHELNKYEMEALSRYGYIFSNSRSKNRRLQVRSEKGQIERVLCLLPKNQTMQHMRDKEKIASLSRYHSWIECTTSVYNYRIDVVISSRNGIIGVEIQDTPISKKGINEKMNVLEDNFAYWFIVMPKKIVHRYDYVLPNNGWILTMSEAIEKLQELL